MRREDGCRELVISADMSAFNGENLTFGPQTGTDNCECSPDEP